MEKLTDIFGIDTFDESTMMARLPKKTYEALKRTMENGEELDAQVAEVVANAMKDWAIERGATHYTHWFQPMTGITAEKHDSFISPIAGGKVIMEFSGKELIKGEPDASSFPSGGLRATFEARGYTTWDCTSPAFLKEDASGVTLCIPTAFCSYTGEALDSKTPLLRSMEAIDKQAVRALKLLGHDEVTHVNVSVGAEQEYFIIDKEKYLKRDDLIFTGRTLFGAKPPKGQELDDHYFGCIKERIGLYMKELNNVLWKLGILAKTQHNEAAPAQHELAPIFTTANISCDHNQLTMETMKKVAARHGLTCLLHEKPFAGVNGSGKHNNWSLVTNTGENLLKPGKKPHENTVFLFFLAAVLKAVDTHADLLRMSASNPGNDLRLGAAEAPPAIISVFLGEQLEDIIAQLIKKGEATSSLKSQNLYSGVHTLPMIKKDATDRNRTSPFAFTGNKFEFRMVASSMSIASSNTVLNTIVAEALSEMSERIEKADDINAEIQKVIAETFAAHQRIIFSGNGYSEEWVKEAERRGLPNLTSMVKAIPSLVTEKSIKVFGSQQVFSETELRSRAEIYYEAYAKAKMIEARTMEEMASRLYIPAVLKFIKNVADSIASIEALLPGTDIAALKTVLSDSVTLLESAKRALVVLKNNIAAAEKIEGSEEAAHYIEENIVTAMCALRAPIDELECIVDKELWPVPTYGDLIFEV